MGFMCSSAGIPRINNVSERPTLRPMPRKNIIDP